MEKKINPRNEVMLRELQDFVSRGSNYFFIDYRGLSVEKLTILRRKIERENAALKVVRNNIANLALKSLNIDNLSSFLFNPTALIVTQEEANSLAKLFVEFTKDTTLKIKGAYIMGESYDEAKVLAYSKLPTKKEAIAMFALVLKAPLSKLARTLKALADSKGE